MGVPLLATKVFVPQPGALASRPRLLSQLAAGLARKLTLISAPAGFGKTTLVSEWVHTTRAPRDAPLQVAWLSLEESDNDLARFLVYCIAALQAAGIAVGHGAMTILQSSQLPPVEAVLTGLINEIAALPTPIVLVLDDYHVIAAPSIHEALLFLLDHQPAQLHVMLTTREDPPLPLARLRARGQMAELRAADLRFTLAEAADFLNGVMGLELSEDDIAALEARTEGWIAGLHLAAISMQGHQDTASFIQSFTGSHRFVMDYLVEEVLQQQPESVQTFLFRTSILDRLCGSLCDAVVGDSAISGQETLDYLEQANLFIVPLDNERRWYRYHHLFAELLRQRCSLPPCIPSGGECKGGNVGGSALHLRASRWYEAHGYEAAAFHHAYAAGDLARAAGLAELAWPKMDNSFQSAAWLGWVKALPDAVIRVRPVLSTDYAQALVDVGELEACESRLQDAERALEGAPGGMVVVDEAQFRTLPARIALTRANHAQVRGDLSGTVRYAELALELIPEDAHFLRSLAIALLGFTNWARGDLAAVAASFTAFSQAMLAAGHPLFAIASSGYLAEIIAAQGRLREALRTYKQAVRLAAEQDAQAQWITAHLHLGLALLYHELGRPEAAAEHLQKGSALGEQMALIDWPYRWRLAQARLQEARGEFAAALDLLDEAKRLYVRNPVPDIRPIAALQARVYLKQGRLAEALAWVQERGVSVDDTLSYMREFEHITLARVLVAVFKRDRESQALVAAQALLARLLDAAEDGKRVGSVIELLIVQAVAYQMQGRLPQAFAVLERALALAEPEGYVRIFVDEGAPVARLLSNPALREHKPDYVRKVLAAFEAEQTGLDEARRPTAQPLIEPLSPRELEVLQLVAQGLSNREIGERLFLTLSTVKGHNRNIFGKLNVKRRTEAVARARALGLL